MEKYSTYIVTDCFCVSMFSVHLLFCGCLLHDAIEGQITEVKGGGGRRRTQLLGDLRNRRIYWELKKEAEDRNRWKQTVYHLKIKNKYLP